MAKKKTRSKSRWDKFVNGKNYTLKDLGRPAVFLIPVAKLKIKLDRLDFRSVENHLHLFLTDNFGAFTTSTVPSFGIYRDVKSEVVADECREYEVSFQGSKRISILMEKLAEIAQLINEECIYFKAGQYTTLIYPKK